MRANDAACPCGTGETYEACCGRFHSGRAAAPTPELLMRSRFTAFATCNVSYLLATWHPSTRPRQLKLDGGQHWYRLDIHDTAGGGAFDVEGCVEFTAFWRSATSHGELRERSRFRHEGGRWFYVDGDIG